MIYLWSDTHFNHQGILKHCASTRPWTSYEEMNAALIEKWNAAVTPTATIYLLGDFGFSHKDRTPLADIFSQLKGHKHLVRGNHDEKNPDVLKLPWETQTDLNTIRHDGKKIIACHYPLETWKDAHRGAVHAHGHSHGSLKRVIPHRFDVGVDVFRNGPVAFNDLFIRADLQTFSAQDHHGDQ